jgi:hypothetical protein
MLTTMPRPVPSLVGKSGAVAARQYCPAQDVTQDVIGLSVAECGVGLGPVEADVPDVPPEVSAAPRSGIFQGG